MKARGRLKGNREKKIFEENLWHGWGGEGTKVVNRETENKRGHVNLKSVKRTKY